MKWFGEAILQLDGVSVDIVMQAINEAIHPNTPFFNSISLKPSHSIDELFQRVNYYAMLENDPKASS